MPISPREAFLLANPNRPPAPMPVRPQPSPPSPNGYAIVRKGAVTKFIRELPVVYMGVADFRKLSAEQQAAHGIVPVMDVTPAYDHTKFRALGVATKTVYSNRVDITKKLVPMPAMNQRAIERAALLNTLDGLTESLKTSSDVRATASAAVSTIRELVAGKKPQP